MSGVQVITKFDPTRLNAAMKNAALASFKVAHEDARARRHNTSKSDVALKVVSEREAALVPRGLQGVFEAGREGGYEINPSGVTGVRSIRKRTGSTRYTTYGVRAGRGDKFVLRFTKGDGGFAAYVTGGPMGQYPAMGPAARDWAAGGYRKTASGTLGLQGFGRKV